MPEYKVKQGDCISKIASQHGFLTKTIWDDSENADLIKMRKDQNILYPGDLVHIPDKKTKEESGSTEELHRFLRKGIPEKLRLRLLDKTQPIANTSYKLEVGEKSYDGETDGDGWMEEHPIPRQAHIDAPGALAPYHSS